MLTGIHAINNNSATKSAASLLLQAATLSLRYQVLHPTCLEAVYSPVVRSMAIESAPKCRLHSRSQPQYHTHDDPAGWSGSPRNQRNKRHQIYHLSLLLITWKMKFSLKMGDSVFLRTLDVRHVRSSGSRNTLTKGSRGKRWVPLPETRMVTSP